MSFPPAADTFVVRNLPAEPPSSSRTMDAGGSPSNRHIRKNACSGERSGRLVAGR